MLPHILRPTLSFVHVSTQSLSDLLVPFVVSLSLFTLFVNMFIYLALVLVYLLENTVLCHTAPSYRQNHMQWPDSEVTFKQCFITRWFKPIIIEAILCLVCGGKNAVWYIEVGFPAWFCPLSGCPFVVCCCTHVCFPPITNIFSQVTITFSKGATTVVVWQWNRPFSSDHRSVQIMPALTKPQI